MKTNLYLLFICFLVMTLVGCGEVDEGRSGDLLGEDYNEMLDDIDRLEERAMVMAIGGDLSEEKVLSFDVYLDVLSVPENEYSRVARGLGFGDDAFLEYSSDFETFVDGGFSAGIANTLFESRMEFVLSGILSSSWKVERLKIENGGQELYLLGKGIDQNSLSYGGRFFSIDNSNFLGCGRNISIMVSRNADKTLKVQLMPVFSRFISDGRDLNLSDYTIGADLKPGQKIFIASSNALTLSPANAIFKTPEKGICDVQLIMLSAVVSK